MNGKLGRETKIGLAVLATLGLILTVVVIQRLTRNGESEQAAAAPLEKGSSDTPSETFDKELKKPDLFAARPTLLSPSKDSKRPEDLGQWSVASDPPRKTPNPSKAAAPPAYPVSLALPEPPRKAADDRYAGGETGPMDNVTASQSKTTRVEVSAVVEDATPPMATNQDARLTGKSLNEAPAPLADSTMGGATALAAGYQDGGRAISAPASTAPSVSMDAPARAPVAAPMTAPAYDRSNATGYGNPSPYSSAVPAYPVANPVRPTEQAPAIGGELRRPDGTYEVQPNENFWLISEKLYGTGMYFKALAQHNRGKIQSSEHLQAGMLVNAPSIKELEQAYPDLCPKSTRRDAALRHRTVSVTPAGLYGGGRAYVVQEGDTLFDIARNELGKASRWAEIYALNREALGKDYHYLTPGMQLTMPSKEIRDSAERTARQPNGTLQR